MTPARDQRRILALSFTVATLAFALPLYERMFHSPGLLLLLRLIVIVQILPMLTCFALGLLLARWVQRPFWLAAYWGILILLTSYSVLRLIQINVGPSLGAVPFPVQIALLSALLLAIAVVAVWRSQLLLREVAALWPIALLVFLFFVAQLVVFDGRPAIASSVPQRATPTKPLVFVLLFDELGRDVLLDKGAIDQSRFPNIKRLADDSVWFTNATTTHRMTCEAIPTMLSGQYVNDSGNDLDEDCRHFIVGDSLLFTALRQHYHINIYENYLRDCRDTPDSTCRGLPYLIATYPNLALIGHFVPSPVRDRFIFLKQWFGDGFHWFTVPLMHEFLTDISSERSPGQVYFVHSLLPHAAYIFDRDGRIVVTPYQAFRGEPDWDARVWSSYRRQTQFVDTLVGEFVDKLKAEGLYDQATIIITGDHGPRPPDDFGGPDYPNAIGPYGPNVPLLIKSPGLEPGLSDVDYQHVDFVPTMLDVLEVERPAGLEGVSAFDPQRPQRQKTFTHGDRTYVFDPASNRWLLRK